MKKTIAIYGLATLVIGLFFVLGNTVVGQTPVITQCPDGTYCVTSVKTTQTRVIRPRIIAPRTYAAVVPKTFMPTATVTQPSIVFETRPAEPVKVVEQPRSPFVVRGLFTDRVRVPRGKTITIE